MGFLNFIALNAIFSIFFKSRQIHKLNFLHDFLFALFIAKLLIFIITIIIKCYSMKMMIIMIMIIIVIIINFIQFIIIKMFVKN